MKTSAQGSSNRRGSSTAVGADVDVRDKLVMDHVGLVKTLAQRLAQRLPPRSLRRLRRSVDTTVATLRHRLGREAREEEIADAMDLSVDAYGKALEQLRMLEIGFVRQVDAPTPDGTPLIELCIDQSESAATILERKELQEHLARAIERLPERERQILVLYYHEELRLAEIGEVIGVCESRVSQLRSLAIARLRTLLRSSLNLQERVA